LAQRTGYDKTIPNSKQEKHGDGLYDKPLYKERVHSPKTSFGGVTMG
jgi:hypothetical protein